MKFIAALCGVLALNVSRGNALWSSFCRYILFINITEACVRDFEVGHWSNSITAIILILLTPSKSGYSESSSLFSYNLSREWILLYTAWNAIFSYSANFAWTSRLVLIPPLIVSELLLKRPEVWLGARCLSLFAHLVLRAVNCTSLYTPGASYLTPTVDSVTHSAIGSRILSYFLMLRAFTSLAFEHLL